VYWATTSGPLFSLSLCIHRLCYPWDRLVIPVLKDRMVFLDDPCLVIVNMITLGDDFGVIPSLSDISTNKCYPLDRLINCVLGAH
jgi:hypothetical protein